MIKKSAFSFVLAALFIIPLISPSEGFSREKKSSLRLWGELTPFVSGDAGTSSGAPEYSDAFDTGFGFGGEFSWRFCRWFSGLVGLGYEVYDGKTYLGFSFDDMEILPVYAGGKFHLIPDATPWDLYLRLDLGAAYLSSVDISYQHLKGIYWDSSWLFLFAAGVGTEYRWGPWGVSLDVKARYLDSPDAALGPASEADGFWTVPVTLGLNYHF